MSLVVPMTWREPKEHFANCYVLPFLHIKLGLMKQFVETLARKSSEDFEYVKTKFKKITEAKLKESVFVGVQIKMN